MLQNGNTSFAAGLGRASGRGTTVAGCACAGDAHPNLLQCLLHLLCVRQRRCQWRKTWTKRMRGSTREQRESDLEIEMPTLPRKHKGGTRTSSIASRSFVSMRIICFPVARSISSICCHVALSCTKLIEMPFRPNRPVRPAEMQDARREQRHSAKGEESKPRQPRQRQSHTRTSSLRICTQRQGHAPIRWMYVSMSGRRSPLCPLWSRSAMSGRS